MIPIPYWIRGVVKSLALPDCSALKLSKLPREPEKTQSREVETPTLEVGSYQCALDIIQP